MPYKNIEDRRKWCQRWRKRNPEYHKNYNKCYFQIKPWAKTLMYIDSRCMRKTNRYYKNGIKNFLNVRNLEYLWFRDKAYLMKQPSIDRLDTKKHYILSNCRFIEWERHKKEVSKNEKGKFIKVNIY